MGGDDNGEGTVIFQVNYLGQLGGGFSREVTRKIEMESQTLDDLQDAIIYRSFGWDDPHLYSFFFDSTPYTQNRKMEYSCDTTPTPSTEEEQTRHRPGFVD